MYGLGERSQYNPDQPRVPAGNSDGGQWTSDGGGDSNGDNNDSSNTGAMGLGIGAIYSTPGGIVYDDKINGQMKKCGWTAEQIDGAKLNGNNIDAINRVNGEPFTPSTRYVSPETGASVVIYNTTNQVVHLGKPSYEYGPASGDVPGAVMRRAPNAGPAIGPEGFGKPTGVEGGEDIPVGNGGVYKFPIKPIESEMEE